MADKISLVAILSAQVAGFKNGMKSAMSSLKDFSAEAKSGIAFGAMSEIGRKAVDVVGGSISGMAKGVVDAGMSFESAMSSVAAISGATGKDFDMLRSKAKEMGATTQFSATEAANAMEYMAMAGWKAEDMTSGISGIMNLAAASGADLATTSDIVTDALTAFGQTAADSGRFADVMAAASANADTNVEMMGETFKYAGAAAGAMGYSVEDLAVATGLMANSGIKGTQAGTSLRSTITRMAKPTKESGTAMKALGISITDAKGKMKPFGEIMKDMRKGMKGMTEDQKASYAAMLGGQEAMSGLLAIANASDADFEKLTKAIDGAAGSAEKMAQVKLDNLKGDVTILQSALEGLAITAFDKVSDSFRGLVQLGTGLVDKLNSALSDGAFVKNIGKYLGVLKDNAVEVGKSFGEAFSAIGDSFSELTGSFGSKDSVSGFSDVIGGITGALKSFAGFLKDNSDIIAKVVSKLPQLLVAYKGFKIVKTLVPGVKAFSSAIVKMAGKGIGAIAAKLFGIAAGEEATGAASSASAKQVLTSAVAFIALGAGVALAGVGLALVAQAAIALADQGALAVGVMGGLVVALAGLAFGASIIGPALTAGAVGFVAFGAAMVLVGAGMALAAGFIKNLVPLVKQVGDTAAQMAGAFAAAAAAVIGAVGELVGNIADGVSQIVTCIGEELCNVFETAGDAISGVVDSISGGIATVVDAISGGFRSVLDGIAGVIESIGTSARNAGQGFELVAEGISLIAGLSLLDIAKSLGAVAVGIGEISLAGEGMGVIGEGVQSIATAIQALSAGQVILASMAQSGDMASQAAVGYFTLAAAIQEIATVSAGVLVAAVSLQGLMTVAITSSTAVATLGTALMTASGAARSASAGVLSVSGALNGVARSGGAAVGAVCRLAGAARNTAAAIRPIGAAAQQATSALIRSFSAAATKAKAAGNAIGKGVLTSIRQGMNLLPKITAQAMNSLVSAIKSGGSRATASARSAASSIVSALRHAVPGATSAGRYIGMGLANGMASQRGRVRSEAAQLASAAERAIRAKARIHSPSKVSQALGEYWGTGYALGISSMVQSTRKAAERLVTVPTLAAGPDLSYHGSLEQDFDYYRNAQYTIQVPVTVDGREFARATATYTQEELNKRQTRDSRKRGIL
ncbi:MAG: phage tail tape measure protein [Oscillospiraceae bacterium]